MKRAVFCCFAVLFALLLAACNQTNITPDDFEMRLLFEDELANFEEEISSVSHEIAAHVLLMSNYDLLDAAENMSFIIGENYGGLFLVAIEANDTERISEIVLLSARAQFENINVGTYNNIAYVSFNYMPTVWPHNLIVALGEFFDEDFEHVIIDLRGTRGICNHGFLHNVIRPNVTEMSQFTGGYIFMAQPWEYEYITNPFTGLPATAQAVVPSAEFLQIHDLPYLNAADTAGLGYAVSDTLTVMPGRITRNGSENAQRNLWILLDEQTQLPLLLTAWMSGDGGAAALVGETALPVNQPFGGLKAGEFAITDVRGRKLEYIEPHHYTRRGMDAFETVLAVISEGR